MEEETAHGKTGSLDFQSHTHVPAGFLHKPQRVHGARVHSRILEVSERLRCLCRQDPQRLPRLDPSWCSMMMSVMASRVENRRSGFSLPVALTKLSGRRLSPVWLGSVSCSRSANRTGGFPASGSLCVFSESRMREIRLSGSMSGNRKQSQAKPD